MLHLQLVANGDLDVFDKFGRHDIGTGSSTTCPIHAGKQAVSRQAGSPFVFEVLPGNFDGMKTIVIGNILDDELGK